MNFLFTTPSRSKGTLTFQSCCDLFPESTRRHKNWLPLKISSEFTGAYSNNDVYGEVSGNPASILRTSSSTLILSNGTLLEVVVAGWNWTEMAIGLTTLLSTTSVLGFSLIPLLAIGLTVFRYNQADPESHPTNARQVWLELSIYAGRLITKDKDVERKIHVTRIY